MEGEMDINRFYTLIEIIGTIAFASSGTMIAIRKGMDFFGIIVLALITALGGGVFRDIILGITPPTAFLKTTYTKVAIIVAILIIFILKISNGKKFLDQKYLTKYVKLMSFLDAVGLGIFTVSGVNLAMKMGHGANTYLLVFVGIVTGCGGGVLRDVCSGTIPIIFTKNTIYAMASFLGALSYILIRPYTIKYSYIIAASVTIITRLFAMKYRWSLPNVNSDLIEDAPDQ